MNNYSVCKYAWSSGYKCSILLVGKKSLSYPDPTQILLWLWLFERNHAILVNNWISSIKNLEKYIPFWKIALVGMDPKEILSHVWKGMY